MDINWLSNLSTGCEIKVLTAEVKKKIEKAADDKEKLTLVNSLKNMTQINDGEEVFVHGFTGWMNGIVNTKCFGSPHINTKYHIFLLSKPNNNEDIVATAQINKKCFNFSVEK
ncbi:MAG: hypothetical protein ACFFFC_00570 [Candidatus Thorarchaeota archaeon]